MFTGWSPELQSRLLQILSTSISNPVNTIAISIPVEHAQPRSQQPTSISNLVNFDLKSCQPNLDLNSYQTNPTSISAPNFDLKSSQHNFDLNSCQTYQTSISILIKRTLPVKQPQCLSSQFLPTEKLAKLIQQSISINSTKSNTFGISIFQILSNFDTKYSLIMQHFQEHIIVFLKIRFDSAVTVQDFSIFICKRNH